MTVTVKSLHLNAPFDEGVPTMEHYNVQSKEIDLDEWKASLQEDQIIIQLLVLSADPYMRGLMKNQNGVNDAFKANDVIKGFVAGKVLASKLAAWKEGDLFGASLPFRTHQLLSKADLSKTIMWKLTDYIDESQISLGVGVLGMPGATVYGGLDVLKPKQGETIFVSAASGAVGSLVGKLAKELYSCKVIGSCGGEEKGELIKTKFSYDHAINYKAANSTEDLTRMLKEVAPEGIDMYFENVGGMHFEAAMDLLRAKGRVAVCGTISAYNSNTPAPLPIKNVMKLIYWQQRVEGFLSSEWLAGIRGTFLPTMHQWITEGKVPVEETFFDSIESWPLAFQSLFTGNHTGKAVVRL